MSNIKTPNPYGKDGATYFDSTGDGGIRCVGASWSVDSNTHVVICAPDIVALKRAWFKFTNRELDVKKAPIILYKYDPEVEEYKGKLNDVVKSNRIDKPLFWYIHPESGCCFIDFEGYLSSDGTAEELGLAIKATVIECKLLLRSLGWKREDIDRLKIDNTDPIPF